MRKFVTGLVAGLVLATSGVAAASQWAWTKDYRGLYCGAQGPNVVCMKKNAKGYVVGINKDFVAVFRQPNAKKPILVKWHDE